MRRFYTESSNITGNTVNFSKEESAHISKVLRLEKGREIIVCTGDGIDLFCRLENVGEHCSALILSLQRNQSEISGELVLFQSVIKNEKMDIIIQKAAEIGVTKIVPVLTERTVVKTDNKTEQKRLRWERIAIEACKQCGRAKFPEIEDILDFNNAIEKFKKYDTKVIAYENEKTISITQVAFSGKRCAYFIGPEGGFADWECSAAIEAGAQSVSLGKRILRAETAAIVTGAALLMLMGEMNV